MTENETESESSNWIQWAIIILVVIALVALAYWYINHETEENNETESETGE